LKEWHVHEQEMLANAIRRMSELAEIIGRREGEQFKFHWDSDIVPAMHRDSESSRLRLVITFREVWNDDLCFYKSELEDYAAGNTATMNRIDTALRIHLEALVRANHKVS
jgi:hypothetical protein